MNPALRNLATVALLLLAAAFFVRPREAPVAITPPGESAPERQVTSSATTGDWQPPVKAQVVHESSQIASETIYEKSSTSQKPPFRWRASIAEAEAELTGDQVVLAYYTSDSCIPCRQLEAEIFVDPALLEWWAKNTVPVRIEDGGRPTPTLVVYRPGSRRYAWAGYGNRSAVVKWFEIAYRKAFQ